MIQLLQRIRSDTEAKSRFMSAHLAIQLYIPLILTDYNSLLETFQLLKPWELQSSSFFFTKHLLVLQRTCKLAAVESQGTCILRGRAWQRRPSRSWRGHCSHETASQPTTSKNNMFVNISARYRISSNFRVDLIFTFSNHKLLNTQKLYSILFSITYFLNRKKWQNDAN